MEDEDVRRLSAQILHGCDYIGLCQDKARSLDFPDGSMIHEINGGHLVIPGDVAQSVTALAYASRMLADVNVGKSAEYLERAKRGFEYLVNRAEPFGPDGFSHLNHGAPEG